MVFSVLGRRWQVRWLQWLRQDFSVILAKACDVWAGAKVKIVCLQGTCHQGNIPYIPSDLLIVWRVGFSFVTSYDHFEHSETFLMSSTSPERYSYEIFFLVEVCWCTFHVQNKETTWAKRYADIFTNFSNCDSIIIQNKFSSVVDVLRCPRWRTYELVLVPIMYFLVQSGFTKCNTFSTKRVKYREWYIYLTT